MIDWRDIIDMAGKYWKGIIVVICVLAAVEIIKLILKIVNAYLDRKILGMRVKILERMLANVLENAQNVYQPTQDEIDAVRYAMKKAHPDNGGNAEDFIRFSAVYETLTRNAQ